MCAFAGSFGVYHQEAEGAGWETRDRGQFNYLLDRYGGPVEVIRLDADPRSPALLWLGAMNGNGPYRSVDGGRNWIRAHQGLGPPGSRPGEDGLPWATEVHAFAFHAGRTWMGSFRGGVWRWDGGGSLTPGRATPLTR